jgi:hypothetical protein
MDHDQLFKVLLKEFFRQFFLLFFPSWAERLDFRHVEWLDKEVFTDPPEGERRSLDLVAKVRALKPATEERAGHPEPWLVLVHAEIESADKVAPFRPRMHGYDRQLRHDYGLPVLPIALYLRVGLEGVGWDVYEERFWKHCLLRFEYAYVGLPALDAETYVTSEHVLGAALAALMQVPEERRAELRAEALRRIATCGENDYRRYLLLTCVLAYWETEEEPDQRVEELLRGEHYEEVRPMAKSMLEVIEKRAELKGQRELLQIQMEARFGTLSRQVQERLGALTAEQLRQVSVAFAKGQTLPELGLEG